MKKTTLALLLGLSTALPISVAITAILPTTAQASVGVDFSSLVEKASAGVVRVSITKKVDSETLATAQAIEMLKDYLGNSANLPQMPVVEQGYGTGFFISRDGYILTNHHVIKDAERITVTLSDRTELDARLIGSDESSDIAVLKVDGNQYPALPVAKTDTLKVGQPVLAIGSPFGFDYSASAGIVSAKSRSIPSEGSVPFIQSDVALNPGNSGGPLFNQQGEVVAVNSMIFSGTGGYMGLSFSIPIATAMDIYEQIKTTGKVTRVRMGVTVQDLDRNLAEVYGLPKPQGALLTQVAQDSPAERAGLRVGDVVLSFNGTPIGLAHEWFDLTNKAKPNQDFSLTYLRQGKTYTAKGNFGEAPADVAAEASSQSDGVRLGLRLRELLPSERRSLSYQGAKGGVMITSVDLVGNASRAGIMAGDVIVGLNNHAITGVDDFADVVASLPKQGVVAVQLIRQGEPAIIGMRIE